jgi:predicted PhzF superfamily epimerase YddE/YHI9
LHGHDTWPVRFHTASGVLTVNGDHQCFEMDFPSRPPVSCELPGLLSALGLETAEVMREPRDFLVIVNHAEVVRKLQPDIAALAKIEMGIGGVIVTAPGENDVDYVCRFFAPSAGIDEDPGTGSIQCTLVPYWAGRTGKRTFRMQQLSPRGARMQCTLAGDRVKIAGETKLYLQGTINL